MGVSCGLVATDWIYVTNPVSCLVRGALGKAVSEPSRSGGGGQTESGEFLSPRTQEVVPAAMSFWFSSVKTENTACPAELLQDQYGIIVC